MKTKQGLITGLIFLAACNHSNALSGGSFELLGEACKSLNSQEKRRQCLLTLEKIRRESKATLDLNTRAKSKVTRVPITFRDVPLGKAGVKTTLAEICMQYENKRAPWDKTEPCDFQAKRTLIWLPYGNLGRSLAAIELGDDESLDSVEIKGSKGAMLGLAEVLQEKYGPPKRTTNSVENKLGTKFDQEIFVWVDAQGHRITVESIYDKVDEGRVVIESAARVAARGIAERQVKEAGKSNL